MFKFFNRKKNKRSVKLVKRSAVQKKSIENIKRNSLLDKFKSLHGQPDINLIFIVSILLISGILAIASASFYYGFTTQDDTFFYPKRQVLWILMGLVAGYVVYLIPMRFFQKFSPIILGLSVLLLLYILPQALFGNTYIDPETGELIQSGLQMPFVESINGAPRWINLGFTYLQPSEFVKYALVLYIAAWLVKDKVQNSSTNLKQHFIEVVIPFTIILGTVCMLILLQKDFDTTVVIGLSILTVYYVSGTRRVHTIGTIILFLFTIIFGTLALFIEGYRRRRVMSWFHIFLYGTPGINSIGVSDALDGAFQVWNGLVGIASGGILGNGFTQSVIKQGYLQEAAYTDSILVVIGEELGFIGVLFVISAFLVLSSIGFKIAKESHTKFNALVAVGVTSVIVYLALLNIAAVLVVIPFGGMPLPFFTYGGSITIATLIGVGLLLNVSKESNNSKIQGKISYKERIPKR